MMFSSSIHLLANDPAIPLLGIYRRNASQVITKASSHPCLFAALFTIAKLWKQTTCPIKKMWYLYMMEFYSATKKKDTLFLT
jgi:hypothetical protein